MTVVSGMPSVPFLSSSLLMTTLCKLCLTLICQIDGNCCLQDTSAAWPLNSQTPKTPRKHSTLTLIRLVTHNTQTTTIISTKKLLRTFLLLLSYICWQLLMYLHQFYVWSFSMIIEKLWRLWLVCNWQSQCWHRFWQHKVVTDIRYMTEQSYY